MIKMNLMMKMMMTIKEEDDLWEIVDRKEKLTRADENIGHNDHDKECFSKYGLKDDHNDHDDDKIDD